ncbi:hypothetical protein [Ruthenibacterium lactatiformans]|uniref:hypothetical protein n=1 Tax=Ruthenibacterium lactatiformans TaxID=1550024 RepID=UPI001967A0BC|nr:hypothetical protein [Ruthenibacterium lactatiformans]MBN3009162.1 hypothetical protein [Ruthenibacterium lactatiformans]
MYENVFSRITDVLDGRNGLPHMFLFPFRPRFADKIKAVLGATKGATYKLKGATSKGNILQQTAPKKIAKPL